MRTERTVRRLTEQARQEERNKYLQLAKTNTSIVAAGVVGCMTILTAVKISWLKKKAAALEKENTAVLEKIDDVKERQITIFENLINISSDTAEILEAITYIDEGESGESPESNS